MINIKPYFIIVISLFLCIIHSCTFMEDTLPESNQSDYIEFVGRSTSYSGQAVQTKTTMDEFENKIHNCYFLLFDNNGNLISAPIELGNTLTTQRFSKHELPSGLTSCTACFIANIPKDIVTSLSSLSVLNKTVLNISYSSVDVIGTNYNSSFVIPEFNLQGNGDMVQCIPMLGMKECDLTSQDIFQISLKRLFSKVTVNVSLGSTLTDASFDPFAIHLYNLPTKVSLAPSNSESAWVKDNTAFLQQQIEGPIDGEPISMLNSSYEFYFYAPEYILNPLSESSYTGPSGTYGTQKFKPKMYDIDKFPVLVKLFGIYKGSYNGNEKDVSYDLYLGEDASKSFSLKRNMHYTNSVKINGLTNSINGSGETLDCRVDISEMDEVEVLGQTANCYIIGSVGSYIYPACKGVHKGGVKDIPDELKCKKGTRLKILKQDNSSIKLDNLAYYPESGEFAFDVIQMDEGGGTFVSNDGNFVLGLVYEENGKELVEWSWHIWVISGALWNIDAFDISTQTYPNGYILMDRNLGACPTLVQQSTPGIVSGLYYKYGHKEPYIGDDYYGGGVSDTYDWSGAEKSRTDPCPPGYRVPQVNVWEAGENGTEPKATQDAIRQAFEFWEDVYYPYSGYVDANLKVQSNGYGAIPENPTYRDKIMIPSNQTNLSGTSSAYLNHSVYGPVTFTNIYYKSYDIYNLGVSAARDTKELEYYYTEKGTDIVSCTIQVGSWKNTGKWYNPNYVADYSKPAENLTGAELKSKYETHYNRLVSVLNGGGGGISDAITSFFSTPKSDYEVKALESASYGYQVRCVKE